MQLESFLDLSSRQSKNHLRAYIPYFLTSTHTEGSVKIDGLCVVDRVSRSRA
jgi:hypothetical protein